MKSAALLVTGACALALSLPSSLFAHGGNYRGGRYTGPGDTTPGTPGGGATPGGPTTPSPGGPTTPTPGGPSTPGPSGGPATPPPVPTGGGGPAPGGGRSGPRTGGTTTVGATSFDEWQYWWEFNKDRFLQLKKLVHSGGTTTGSDDFIMGRGLKGSAIDTLAPTESDRKRIIKDLEKALAETSNRDITSSCLIALAKVRPESSLVSLFQKYLPDADQEKRETAAVAMGIAAIEDCVPTLLSLALDTPEGRKLVQRAEVEFRTRSFACYGLGLIAYRSKNQVLKKKIYEAMKGIVDKGYKRTRRDIVIAGLQAIRLLRPDVSTPVGKQLRTDAVTYLTAYMDRPDREVYAHVRSHAYIALGDLVGRGGDEKGGVKARMIADLKNRRQKQWIHQSAVLALGQIAVPSDLDACKALMDYLASGKDIQAKNFCAIAIGQIGGPKNRAFLLGKLSRSKSYVKPWLALGIAVMDFNTRRTQPGYEGDMTAGFAVRQQFGKTKNPMYAAGMAVALGVMKNLDAGPEILERLHKVQSNEEPAGYLALSLGLMGYHDAKEDISALVERSTRRQKLLTQCSVALGLLGDKNISMKLVARMRDHGNVVAVQSALAQALGLIGDRRCIAHLTQTLQDKNYKRIPRAFAAVALGLVGDKEEFPWNSKIAVNNNYRATIETLTGNGTGILDIL